MTEIDEASEEWIEGELVMAFQNANTQFMHVTQILSSSINAFVTAYTAKQVELIANCKTIEEVHEVLAIKHPKGE